MLICGNIGHTRFYQVAMRLLSGWDKGKKENGVSKMYSAWHRT